MLSRPPSRSPSRSRADLHAAAAVDEAVDGAADAAGRRVVVLPVRWPFAWTDLLDFLALRAVPGVERVVGGGYERTLRLPHGPAFVRLTAQSEHVHCELDGADARDVELAVQLCGRVVDLDADPDAVSACLAADLLLAPLVAARPGLRVPGHVDGFEIAVRAVVGQQISVAGARAIVRRLVVAYGESVSPADWGMRGGADAPAIPPLTHLFPEAAVLAGIDPESLPMPRARGRSLVGLSAAIADGTVVLDASVDRDCVRASLLAQPGIGPWTADYIVMRALGDPDVFLPTDVGVRHALRARGADPRRARGLAQAWRPWRSYALVHLWTALGARSAAPAGATR